MAIAGKVAITPGGEWSVTVAYDKLVVVTYNNNVYLSTKPSTGVEPTDTEHWMLLVENVTQEQYDAIINGTTPVGNANKLGGKGASEYALESDTMKQAYLNRWDYSYSEENMKSIISEYITSNLLDNRVRTVSVDVKYNQGRMYSYLISCNGTGYFMVLEWSFYNDTAKLYRYANGTWTNFAFATTADLANYLRLDGGTLSGVLSVNGGWNTLAGDSAHASIMARSSAHGNNYRALRILNSTIEANTDNALEFYEFIDGIGTNRKILHTGNKPTGTYVGNGDATSRTIATGGIGKCLYIQGNDSMCFVGAYGGIMIDLASDGVKRLHYNEIHFENGVLTITTALKPNLSADDYYYEVL